MKKILITIGFLLFAGISVWAQAPNQFNYQGVARSAAGLPLATTSISLRLTIFDGSSTGTMVYQETHVGITTNTFGLYNVGIGSGTVTSGSWAGINWSTGNKYLQVELDPTGGSSYTVLGNNELLSAPYAMYANNAGTATTATSATTATTATTITGTVPMGGDVTGTNAAATVTGIQGRPVSATAPVSGQGLIWSGTQWAPAAVSGSGTVTSVTAGSGLSGGTITSSGTISMPGVGTPGTYGSSTSIPVITTDAQGRVSGVTTATITAGGSGTVTSVTAGTGLSGGTITSSGTISLPNVGTSGTYGSATTIPVITTDAQGRVSSVTTATITAGGGGTVAGTTNYVPVFTSASAIGNSVMYQNGSQLGIGVTTTLATLDAESTVDTIVSFVGTSSSTVPGHGVARVEYDAATDGAIGIVGTTLDNVSNTGTIGILGGGTSIGIEGFGESNTTTEGTYGVYGQTNSDGFLSIAVGGFPNGYSTGATYNIGIYGDAIDATIPGTGNYAGYFDGDVYINGSMSASTKTFKIDDPLDPANKYLYHSCVESPDMMNIYNGNVTTDASGTATVTLPDYFDALNRDCRYQLTVIGTFAQAIVSKEVSGNTFEIKTSVPNVKVSWQVTGIRKDAYAAAHPIVAEVEKESFNKGKYLAAKEMGQPQSKQIGHFKAKTNNAKEVLKTKAVKAKQ